MTAALATSPTTTDVKIKRVVIYARQSFDRTGQRLGVERQLDPCRRVVRDRDGWIPGREYVENNRSAKGTAVRPVFADMIAAIRRGEVDVVLAWDMSRLTRNARDRLTLVEACREHHVIIAFVQGSDIDPSTWQGRMLLGMLGEVAVAEVDAKGERMIEANEQAVRDGRPNTAVRSVFGFGADKITPVAAEADAIRWACESLLSGGSLRAIAREWERRGLKPRQGEVWHATTIARILRNPRIAAVRVRDGQEYPGTWKDAHGADIPAIVSVETWRAVVDKLIDPERTNARGVTTLLGGIATCPCGNVVFGAITRTGAPGYRCRQTGRGHIVRGGREDIDRAVSELIIDRLSRPDAVDLLRADRSPDVEALRSRRRALAARIEELGTNLAEPDIPVGITKDAIKSARRDLEAVDAELTALAAPSVLAPLVGAADVRAAWERHDIDAQRAVVATLVNVTLLAPKRGPRPFDRNTVDIQWRHDS